MTLQFTEQQLLDMAAYCKRSNSPIAKETTQMLRQAAADRRRVEALEKAIDMLLLSTTDEWHRRSAVSFILARTAELEQHKDG
jgi:hypothetical protein